MTTISELKSITSNHKLWLLSDQEEGSCANLEGADLRDIDLEGVDLRRAELQYAYLRNTNLVNADLRGANLTGARLMITNLKGANLRDANLRGSNLRGAILRNTNLANADLRGADLEVADLEGADLSGANLRGANLRGAYLQRSNLKGADLDFDIQQGLLEDIVKIVTKEEDKLEMDKWHSDCGTTHCLAGWACRLNSRARQLENSHGTEIAGLLTLGVEAHSYFFKSNKQTMDWLKTKGK